MRINSIFRSVDGEVNYWGQGTQTTFIRFQGCNLNCSYCDTQYARDKKGGMEMTVEEVIKRVEKFKTRKVTITGGEPYLQKRELGALVSRLYSSHGITIETNGSFEPNIWPIFHVVDFKLPSSKMEEKMNVYNFSGLTPQDFVKFVVQDRYDFSIAIRMMPVLKARGCRARFAFSPVWESVEPATLLGWMEDEGIFDSVLNFQLHKSLGIM